MQVQMNQLQFLKERKNKLFPILILHFNFWYELIIRYFYIYTEKYYWLYNIHVLIFI